MFSNLNIIGFDKSIMLHMKIIDIIIHVGKITKYPSNITASCLEPEEGSVTITRLMHQLIGRS